MRLNLKLNCQVEIVVSVCPFSSMYSILIYIFKLNLREVKLEVELPGRDWCRGMSILIHECESYLNDL